jgi:DNA repair exonuclease SbcCD ATPase subunit
LKFNHLKINGFGKLVGKDIELKSGINVIYGENEAGKSSLLKFLTGMLYGASKNKNGKNISDFDRYKPWKTEEFSGSIEYSLENGESFEVYREFKKKNPVIYNSEKEDISKEFKENKTKGIAFFEEQTGVEEEVYLSTAIIEQDEVKLAQSSQNAIIQKISNKVSSGDDNVSYKKSLAQIIKMQGEKVGTDRTQNRPINLVNSEIKSLENKRKELEDIKEIQNANDKDFENLEYKLKMEENQLELIKSLKALDENNRLRYAEINFSKNAEDENVKKINNLREELNHGKHEETKETAKLSNIHYVVLAILIILSILLFCLLPNKILGVIALVFAILEIANIVIKASLNKKKLALEKDKAQEDILKEINILKKNNEEKSIEINTRLNKLNAEVDFEKDKIFNKFNAILEIGYLEKVFSFDFDKLVKEAEIKEKEIENLKRQLHEIEFEKKAENKQLEELASIVEKLDCLYEEREELLSLNNSYNIAKECLEKAYDEVKKNISPRFTENLCKSIARISNNSYDFVKVSDEEGLVVGIENGSYVPAERLSIGTIDQMYLALRLSAINEMTDEKMPIILDEAFAYFDNNRLKNILEYLNSEYKEHQILIFTCSNREQTALEKNNIEYNLIKL